MRPIAMGLLTIVLLSSPLAAQQGGCPKNQVDVSDALEQAVKDAEASLEESNVPSDRQIAAPSSSAKDGATLVDHASFPAILGAALDDKLITTADRSATVDLNLFAFRTLVNSKLVSQQTLYEQYKNLRKWGGSLTFGGQGDTFDRDGDGKVDAPLDAKDFGDIVDYEVRFRISKTTDRRESYNYDEIFSAVGENDDHVLDQFDSFIEAHQKEIDKIMDDQGCADKGRFDDLLRNAKEELSAIGKSLVDGNDKVKRALDKIDRRPIWSVFAGGSQRRQQFGPNSFKAGVRAELFKSDKRENTFNLEWSRKQALLGMPEMKTLKGAFQHTYTWMKDSTVAPDGIDVSASASFEHTEDVPDVKHPDIAKANVKLEYPLTKAMKIPISVSWANHADLLTDERDVRGHIGFTVDFSKLTKPANDKTSQ